MLLGRPLLTDPIRSLLDRFRSLFGLPAHRYGPNGILTTPSFPLGFPLDIPMSIGRPPGQHDISPTIMLLAQPVRPIALQHIFYPEGIDP